MKKSTQDVVDGLSHLLADTYLLYLKTQNFHWNVTGPHFHTLHKMFEEQYEQLSSANDLIAERIRALHAKAPGSFGEFLKMASLQEAEGDVSAELMIKELLIDHESMSSSLQKLFALAQEDGDEVTLDMLIERKTEHDKTAWMLRSTLEK